jgi:hypothetical protein
MNKKLGIVAALAAITLRMGVPDAAFSQDADARTAALINLNIRCEAYKNISDRSVLQQELEKLLFLNPDDECVDYIVGLLGGAPVASISGLGDPFGNGPAITVASVSEPY